MQKSKEEKEGYFMSESITITWLGHSCFQIEKEGYTVVTDPFEDGSVPGFLPVRTEANLVLCSHDHKDHGAEWVVGRKPERDCPFRIETISTYHDDKKGALRGKNTIHILSDGTFRLAHLGDLGCELTKEEIGRLKGVDVLFLPVGGFYTIDAAQAKRIAEQIQPRVTVPMHYRGEGFGYEVLSTVDAYTDLCSDVVVCPGNVLTVDQDTKKQTALLQIPG